IQPDHLARAECRGQAQVPPLPTPAIEDEPTLEALGLDGSDPAAELFLVLWANLRKPRPLVSEAGRGGRHLGGQVCGDEARNAALPWILAATPLAAERALAQLAVDDRSRGDDEHSPATRTREPVEQPKLHAGRYRAAHSWKTSSV